MPDFYFERQLEARGSRAPFVGRNSILTFFIVYLIASLISSIPPAAYMFFQSLRGYLDIIKLYGTDEIKLTEEVGKLFDSIYGTNTYMIVYLVSQAVMIVTAMLFCRILEKRSLRSMGLLLKSSVPHYFLGAVIGAAMLSIAFLPSFAVGSFRYVGSGNFNVGIILLFLLGYMVQGAAQEMFLRGYFMVSYSSNHRLHSAVFISSILFTILNLGSAGNVVGIINTFLFGAFLAYYFIRTGSIFGSCAIHTAWNFAQGHLFGLSVDWSPLYDSFFRFTPTEKLTLLGGGVYGVESGLFTTLVLLAALALVIFIPTKRQYVEL